MSNEMNVDIKDLNSLQDVERIPANQFKFLSPFRCVFFG